jgi:Domain of unknown function (DUF4157)
MRSFAPKLGSSPKPVSAGSPRSNVPRTASTHLNYDFGRIPVHPPAAQAETTVTISEPSDQDEQQADRLADQVMSGKRPTDSPGLAATSHAQNRIAASSDYSSRGENALEPEDRRFFESRFHHNFADVKIYSDREANRSALALHARAYTTGNTISFAAGEYRPGTAEGRHLLAHELSHVIQQRGVATPSIPLIQRQPADKPKQTPAQQPAKPKTLRESKVDTGDPVFKGTSQIIDEVL